MPKPGKHIFVCTQGRPPGHPRGSCAEKGAGGVFEAFLAQFDQRGLFGPFQVTNTGCMGPCLNGTNVLVYPEGVMYGGVTADDVAEIIESHLLEDKPVERLLMPAEIWS